MAGALQQHHQQPASCQGGSGRGTSQVRRAQHRTQKLTAGSTEASPWPPHPLRFLRVRDAAAQRWEKAHARIRGAARPSIQIRQAPALTPTAPAAQLAVAGARAPRRWQSGHLLHKVLVGMWQVLTTVIASRYRCLLPTARLVGCLCAAHFHPDAAFGMLARVQEEQHQQLEPTTMSTGVLVAAGRAAGHQEPGRLFFPSVVYLFEHRKVG